MYILEIVTFLLTGDGQFGDKSVGDITTEYMEASRQNPYKFQPPRISFIFFDGITESVSREQITRCICYQRI